MECTVELFDCSPAANSTITSHFVRTLRYAYRFRLTSCDLSFLVAAGAMRLTIGGQMQSLRRN